ncbi:hypothetical protein ACFU98_15020 [Streptomyces sp. NPDC057575]|uniref:hypothetical protein n=1 Tax=unclassified Streptomyces TaxID=2593676 RepID=UPI0036A855BF
MASALAEHCGRWTVGRRWAHDEGDFDEGPVGNWCCPSHSITTPEETLARVTAALCEWRGVHSGPYGRYRRCRDVPQRPH